MGAGCSGLLRREAERRDRAAEVMTSLAVLSRWRRVGRPFLCGACAYGLLVAPDIDIEIYGPRDMDAGFSIAAAMAHQPGVDRVLFIDAVDEEDGGLGWEVSSTDSTGCRWRIQMWLLSVDYPGPRSADLVRPMRDRLDDRSRCSILRLKEYLVASGTAYRSIDVYRAVLDHAVTEPDEYLRWARTNSSTGLVGWSPVH